MSTIGDTPLTAVPEWNAPPLEIPHPPGHWTVEQEPEPEPEPDPEP